MIKCKHIKCINKHGEKTSPQEVFSRMMTLSSRFISPAMVMVALHIARIQIIQTPGNISEESFHKPYVTSPDSKDSCHR